MPDTHVTAPELVGQPAASGTQPGAAPPQEEIALEEIAPADDHRKRRTWLIRGLSIVIVIGLWELIGRHVNPLYMSYPSSIARAGWDMTVSGQLPSALATSGRTLILGFVIASVIGILVGMFIGRYPDVEAACDWLVNALYATPLVALVPLLVLWFGLGFEAKLFIVVMMAVFPILINTAAGVRNVSPSLIDVGRAFDTDERGIFTKIILPAALPYIMTGLRLGIGRAIIGMIVAEFFTGLSGLGALVVTYGNAFRTNAMLVPILVLMAMGVLLTSLVRWAEVRIAPWKEDDGSR
jgi:NitT/TauT family transport system permease protein